MESYFVTKNAPDKGDKKSKLDDIKMEIYDSYLNEDFGDIRDRPPNVSAAESKVMKEFFMEADKYEEKYMNSTEITPFEMAKGSGHALLCGIEFTQAFPDLERDGLLKDEIGSILTSLRASKKKKSKKKKSKKKKSKKKKSKKKSKKRKSK